MKRGAIESQIKLKFIRKNGANYVIFQSIDGFKIKRADFKKLCIDSSVKKQK